jgi:hypothetical protein
MARNASIGAVLALTLSSYPAFAEMHLMSEHVPPITARLRPVGRVAPNTPIDLIVGLALRNVDLLTYQTNQIYDPRNSNFRHYITPEQFADAFSPSVAEYQSLIDFFRSQHFSIVGAFKQTKQMSHRISNSYIQNRGLDDYGLLKKTTPKRVSKLGNPIA